MNFGIVSRSFGRPSAAETAAAIREKGFDSTELCFTFAEAPYWAYNGHTDMTGLTDAVAADIVKKFRAEDVNIVSIGAFSSLFEPDEAAQKANLAAYERYIRIAADNGIASVATECGFIPGRRGILADSYEKDFAYFRGNLLTVLEYCEKYGVNLALECCLLDLVPSARRARDLITQCGSERLKVLLDPANLIANSDEEDIFRYLTPHIAYFHAKDRKINAAYGCAVGDGDIDWVKFMTLYHRHCEDVPILFEYVGADNCVEVRDRLAAFDRAACETI